MHTTGKRGVVVCSDRFMSAVLGDGTGMLGTAGREGTLTSRGQNAEAPNSTSSGYCSMPHVARLSAVLPISVIIGVRLVLRNLAVLRVNRQTFIDFDSA